jgi:hypothetical protein
VKEPLYDPKKQTSLYQLSKYVLFDTTCRYIIIRKKDNIDQIDVYDCTTGHTGKANRVFENVSKPGIVVDTPTSIIHTNFSSFKPIYISDLNGANLVLCVPIPSCEKTAVAVISMDPTSQGLIFPRNVKIFNKDCTPTTAVTTAPVPVPSTAPVPVPSTTPVTTPATATSSTGKKDASMNSPCNMYQNTNIPSLDSIISDYYSKYWNNNNPVLTVDGVKRYSNDFLLKTQMIPPYVLLVQQITTVRVLIVEEMVVLECLIFQEILLKHKKILLVNMKCLILQEISLKLKKMLLKVSNIQMPLKQNQKHL